MSKLFLSGLLCHATKYCEAILHVRNPMDALINVNFKHNKNKRKTKPGRSLLEVRRWDSGFEFNSGHWYLLCLGFYVLPLSCITRGFVKQVSAFKEVIKKYL